MRFHQLAVGTRFSFHDEIYTKVSPLIAVQEQSGEQKFMAQSALVQRLEGPEDKPPPAGSDRLDAADVLRAFDNFYEDCLETLHRLDAMGESLGVERARKDLSQARRRFLRALSLQAEGDTGW
jgi:hypothetical protein